MHVGFDFNLVFLCWNAIQRVHGSVCDMDVGCGGKFGLGNTFVGKFIHDFMP